MPPTRIELVTYTLGMCRSIQLSYEGNEYTQRDLNPQPTRYERAALTVELWVLIMVGAAGFEPAYRANQTLTGV